MVVTRLTSLHSIGSQRSKSGRRTIGCGVGRALVVTPFSYFVSGGAPNFGAMARTRRSARSNGHRLIEHGGAWQGFTCGISRFPDDSVTVVVLTNFAAAGPGQLAHAIAGFGNKSLAPPAPRVHTATTIDPKTFDAYVGAYRLAPNAMITISRTGEHYFAQLTGQDPLEILPEAPHEFFLKVVDAQLTFVTDATGRATEVVLHQNGNDRHAKRVGPQRAGSEPLQSAFAVVQRIATDSQVNL